MNWDRTEGNSRRLKSKAERERGTRADDRVDVIAGERDQLLGAIQEQYGITRDEAEKRIAAFEERFGGPDSSSRH